MENKLYYTILRWRNRPTRTDRKWQRKVFKRADFIWWKRALKAARVYDSPRERGRSGVARSPAQAFFKNRGDGHPRARLTGAPQLDPGTPGDHHGAVSLHVSLLLRLIMVLLWRPSARPQPNTPGKATAPPTSRSGRRQETQIHTGREASLLFPRSPESTKKLYFSPRRRNGHWRCNDSGQYNKRGRQPSCISTYTVR